MGHIWRYGRIDGFIGGEHSERKEVGVESVMFRVGIYVEGSMKLSITGVWAGHFKH